MRIGLILLLLAGVIMGQKYSGPRPPNPDLLYLKHASNLIALEANDAKEEAGKKEEITYVIPGPSSPVKTPLASPILLMVSEKLRPDTLQLFKLESRNGRRELFASPKKPPKPIRVSVTRLSADDVYQLEVDESLPAGEYSFSPTGSNRVFCFQVF